MEVVEAKNSYLEDFTRFEAESTEGMPAWIPPLRKAALSRFAELGFPTRHDEEWRGTNLASLVETPFRRVGRAQSQAEEEALSSGAFAAYAASFLTLLPAAESHRIVLVNGRYAALTAAQDAAPAPQGVLITGLRRALAATPEKVEPHLARHAGFEHQPFVALNTAYLQDGALVNNPANT